MEIFSNKARYNKNQEKISTTGNSKAIDEENRVVIEAKKFIYNKIDNITYAEGDVKIEDEINKYKIFSNKLVNKTRKKFQQLVIQKLSMKKIEWSQQINLSITKKPNYYAEGSVLMEDVNDNYNIKSEKITYFLDEKRIITNGGTIAEIDTKYYVN